MHKSDVETLKPLVHTHTENGQVDLMKIVLHICVFWNEGEGEGAFFRIWEIFLCEV